MVANRTGFEAGAQIDPQLINPWGIALRPPGIGGHIWISNAGHASTSTYIGDVKGRPLFQDGLKLVLLDGPKISYEDGLHNVTGQVYNAASDFPNQPVEFPVSGPASDLSKGRAVPIGTVSGSAKFVFVTTDGTINAWRSGTAESMDTAVIVKDYSDRGPDQIRSLRYLPAFTGVAISTNSKANNRLYVADFQNNVIRVLNNQWIDITTTIPFERPSTLPAAYSPFNIQCLDGRLYIAYAELDPNAEEPATDLPAPGAGQVVAYDLDGHIVQEFSEAGSLNSPWGLAIAPRDFGPFGGALLVGNFGDGTIAAFDLGTGAFRDFLRDESGRAISIDGLWGLTFGNGVSLGDADSLYFAAGPNQEQDGIFGRLRYAGTSSSALSTQDSRTDARAQPFVLIFRQGAPQTTDPSRLHHHEETHAWVRQQNAGGRKVDWRALSADTVQQGTGPVAGNAQGTVTALLFLEAVNLAEASKLAESHPARRGDVSIEVRPWTGVGPLAP